MDNRHSARQPQRYIAWLDPEHGAPPIRCYVEDVSEGGAKLQVYRSAVPDEFTLCFSRKGDAKVRCRVRWRAGPALGVEFMAARPQPTGQAPAPAPGEVRPAARSAAG